MDHHRKFLLIALAVALALCGRTRAAEVNLGSSGWQAVFDNSLDPFVSITVVGEGTNAVFIQKSANFTQAPDPTGQIPAINIVFRQVSAGAVPNIVIENEIITNSSGAPWAAYRMLTVDTAGDAAFNPTATLNSGGPPPIGYAIAPFTTAVFSSNNQILDFGGGIVSPGSQWLPGSPSPGGGQLWISVNPKPSEPFTLFSLKEFPIVPEPTSLGLLALIGTALLRRRMN